MGVVALPWAEFLHCSPAGAPSLFAGPNGRRVLLQLDPPISTLPQALTPLAYSHGQLSFLRPVVDISQELCALTGHTCSRGLIVYISPCFTTNVHYWAIFIFFFRSHVSMSSHGFLSWENQKCENSDSSFCPVGKATQRCCFNGFGWKVGRSVQINLQL